MSKYKMRATCVGCGRRTAIPWRHERIAFRKGDILHPTYELLCLCKECGSKDERGLARKLLLMTKGVSTWLDAAMMMAEFPEVMEITTLEPNGTQDDSAILRTCYFRGENGQLDVRTVLSTNTVRVPSISYNCYGRDNRLLFFSCHGLVEVVDRNLFPWKK